MIRNNTIQSFPVTVEDIEIEEKLFGPDVYTLKGRTKRQSKKVVVDDFIEISRELIENNQKLILCTGIMFINQQELLKTIEKYIRLCRLVPLGNITKEGCYMDLDVVMRH